MAHEPVTRLPPVQEWLFELSEDLVGRHNRSADPNPPDTLLAAFDTWRRDRFPQGHVTLTLSLLLREAVRLGHGGAFVVVPDVSAAPLNPKYRVSPEDVGALPIRMWEECPRAGGGLTAGQSHEAAHRHRQAIHLWRSRVRATGALSATGGGVVLDRRLVLHGFGGSINAPPSPEGRSCYHMTCTAEVPSEAVLKPLGQRHKSAYQLVAAVPHAFAFVVSQDGDLRLFASDDEKVYFADGLRPD